MAGRLLPRRNPFRVVRRPGRGGDDAGTESSRSGRFCDAVATVGEGRVAAMVTRASGGESVRAAPAVAYSRALPRMAGNARTGRSLTLSGRGDAAPQRRSGADDDEDPAISTTRVEGAGDECADG